MIGHVVSIAMGMKVEFPMHTRVRTLLAALVFLVACSSPNRGVWRGSFEGTLSGTVEFRINARGSKLTGSLDGATSDGEPFSAKMTGKLNGADFYATFKGKGQTGLLPVPFEGLMTGRLEQGEGQGDWQAELRTGWKMSGSWTVKQTRPTS